MEGAVSLPASTPNGPSAVLRYGSAFVLVALATLARLLLNPVFGNNLPFIVFLLPVLAVSWYGGWKAGLLAVLLSALSAAYFFVPPANSFAITGVQEWAGLATFVAVGLISSALAESQRRARVNAEAAAAEARRIGGALAARERFVSTTLRSVGDAVIATDAQGRITLMNAVAETLTGWPEAEAVGKPAGEVFRIVNQETRADVDSPVDRVIRENRVVGLANHTLLLARDGVEHPIDDSGAPIRDEAGALMGVVLVFRDITERYASESALRESHQRLINVLESASDAFIALDRAWNVTYINEQALKINGLRRDEVIGHNHWERWPETVGTRFEAEYRRAVAENVPRHFEEYYPPYDRYLDIHAYPSEDGLGLFFQDVSERRRSEVALRETVQRLEFHVENTPLANIEWDREFRVAAWSGQAEAIFGWKAEEVLGKRPMEWPFVHPDDRAYVNDVITRLTDGAEDRTICRNRNLRKNGETIHFEWYHSALRDSAGNLVSVLSLGQDISDRERAQASLVRAYEEEHRIAEELQRSLLLTPRRGEFPGLDMETFYRPAWDEAQVGGDFYDFFALDGGRVALVVGDVAGKGLSAATRTAEVKFALRAFLREHPAPDTALTRLNAFLCESEALDSRDHEGFICLCIVTLNPKTGEAIFAVAGGEPPLIARAEGQTVEEVPASGPPLGILPREQYEALTVSLGPGDVLALTTDGITEARNGRAFFGLTGIAARLRDEMAASGSLETMRESILDGALAFSKTGRLNDDVCLLLIRLSTD